MRLDLGAFRVLSRRDFWKDLWHEINKDDCWGLAAQLSFYFLLAFFPFLIFVSALITLIPSDPNLLAKILAELHPFLPDRTFVTVHRIVMRLVMAEDSPGALSLGIALALWPASLGFSGMVGMLNRAYVLQETRSYLSIRALAIAVTVGSFLAGGAFRDPDFHRRCPAQPGPVPSGPVVLPKPGVSASRSLFTDSLVSHFWTSESGNPDRLFRLTGPALSLETAFSRQCGCFGGLDRGFQVLFPLR